MQTQANQRVLPPLTDGIVFALARLVDDSQKDRRDPSHYDIDFCVTQSGLKKGDPKTQGSPVGKAKRISSILNWAIDEEFDSGRKFVMLLINKVRACGGFRTESPNYVGSESITNLKREFELEGFNLTHSGELLPISLDTLTGPKMTAALEKYTSRALRGATDAALVIGTSKDLVEATAAHVLIELWPEPSIPHKFPDLLGMAFTALEFKTSKEKREKNETPQHGLQRALYDAACSINRLRNKEGTGHGHPWLTSISEPEARHAIQVMGTVADMMLRALKDMT